MGVFSALFGSNNDPEEPKVEFDKYEEYQKEIESFELEPPQGEVKTAMTPKVMAVSLPLKDKEK